MIKMASHVGGCLCFNNIIIIVIAPSTKGGRIVDQFSPSSISGLVPKLEAQCQ